METNDLVVSNRSLAANSGLYHRAARYREPCFFGIKSSAEARRTACSKIYQAHEASCGTPITFTNTRVLARQVESHCCSIQGNTKRVPEKPVPDL